MLGNVSQTSFQVHIEARKLLHAQYSCTSHLKTVSQPCSPVILLRKERKEFPSSTLEHSLRTSETAGHQSKTQLPDKGNRSSAAKLEAQGPPAKATASQCFSRHFKADGVT